MKKLLIALAVALVLCVPAFADNVSSFATSGFGASYTNGSEFTNVYTEKTSADPVYFYILFRNSIYTINAISENQGAEYLINGDDLGGGIYVCNSAIGDYYQRIASTIGDSSNYATFASSPALSVFTGSDADIAAAFADFLENPNVSPSGTVRFSVPAGNVLYFKVDVEQDVSFTAVMPVLSSLTGTVNGAWNSGIEYGAAASLPSSGTTFPLASQDPINFAKSASNQNLLGQTKNALSQKHCIANQYYALYCPYHYGGFLALGSSHVYPDGAVTGGVIGANVTVVGSFSEIKIYPLSEKANGSLLSGSVTLDSGSDDGFASYFDGEPSANGSVTWLDQNGNPASPSVGGTSYVPEEVSTQSIVEQIKGVLDNIISELKSLFSFGYEAIQSLTGLMQDFVSVFSGLYTWLPDPVYSALISAVVVSIVIGVFKVFL